MLDLAQVVSGPLAARNLADLGANVIKIENPHTGDIMRGINGKDPPIFHVVNRNKRSVALDLRQEQGRRRLRGSQAGRRRGIPAARRERLEIHEDRANL